MKKKFRSLARSASVDVWMVPWMDRMDYCPYGCSSSFLDGFSQRTMSYDNLAEALGEGLAECMGDSLVEQLGLGGAGAR